MINLFEEGKIDVDQEGWMEEAGSKLGIDGEKMKVVTDLVRGKYHELVDGVGKEPRIRTSESKDDPAMLTENPGGIDLNSEKLKMNVQGGEFKFNTPAGFDEINPDMINGITPVIINIVPIVNFPLMLGLVEEKVPQELSAAMN